MKEQENSGVSPPMAPMRVMTLIKALAESRNGLTLTELSISSDIPKSSLANLLRALSEGGFVESENKLYFLGTEMFRITTMIGRSNRFPANSHHILERLRRESGETALIGVSNAALEYLVYVDVAESDNSLRFSPNLGERRPIQKAAAGKVLIAFSNTQQLEAFYVQAKLLPELAFDVFVDEIQQIRAQRYCISSSSVPGVTAIMVPVFTKDSTVIASVGVSGPSERITINKAAYLKLALQAARDMSERQGYKPQ
jgi:IclR family acetate operon transcriptional repressor